MVALIRELANTLFFTLTTIIQPLQMACLLSTMDIDVDTDIIKGRFISLVKSVPESHQ